MSTAVSILSNPFSWPAWADGEQTGDYVPTGAAGAERIEEARLGWQAFALITTLTTAPVTPTAVLESLAGTGGSIDNLVDEDQTDALPRTNWQAFFGQVAKHFEAESGEAPEAAELIAEIKATLGISITNLATITGVSRRAIYDWIGGSQVSEANYARLLELRQIARNWRRQTSRPMGRLLRIKDEAGEAFVELLSQYPLPKARIALRMNALASMEEQQAEQQQERRQERKSRLAPLSEQDRYENALTHATPATHS